MSAALDVGILTIGTEVVSGQIVNSNSGWIANALTNLRLNPKWHLTVADLRTDMLEALSFLQSRVQVIIVTGGLGPTSDDFTREIVSEWASKPLDFDPDSWEHIVERFQNLGITPPESNRQQCYFPKGAQILFNRQGTAHGFRLTVNDTVCIVLPGPPEEIKAIWNDHVASDLQKQALHTEAHELRRWQCLGQSESQLGELVEGIIKGSTLVAGYRPHLPYIEIKIWCRSSLRAKEQNVIDQLDAALDRWTVVRDDEDALDFLLHNIRDFDEVHIDDSASLGAISQRLGLKWKGDSSIQLKVVEDFSPGHKAQDIRGPRRLQLVIGPLTGDGSWEVWYETDHVRKQKTLKLPYKRHPERRSRERLFVCEQSLAAFARMLEKGDLVL